MENTGFRYKKKLTTESCIYTKFWTVSVMGTNIEAVSRILECFSI